jgi:hypothetical protein
MTPLIERQDVPGGLGEEAIETGLVGRLSELVMDAQDGLALGDDESGEILGEVPPLALVDEEVAVVVQGVLDELGELDDARHDRMLLRRDCAGADRGPNGPILPILTPPATTLQNASSNWTMYFGPTCGANSRRNAERNSVWKSSQ